MSMMVGMDLQAALKKSNTRRRASVRFAEFGGTPIFLNVKGAAIWSNACLIAESRFFFFFSLPEITKAKKTKWKEHSTTNRFERETVNDVVLASNGEMGLIDKIIFWRKILQIKQFVIICFGLLDDVVLHWVAKWAYTSQFDLREKKTEMLPDVWRRRFKTQRRNGLIK